MQTRDTSMGGTLKLLVVGPYGETVSGPSRVLTEVVDNLPPDYEILVVSPRRRRIAGSHPVAKSNLTVHYQPCGSIPGIPGSNKIIEIIRVALRLERIDFEPDLVWAHSELGFASVLLSKFRRKPCIATVHGVFGEFYEREAALRLKSPVSRVVSLLTRRLQRIEFSKAGVLTTYSTFLRQEILRIHPDSKVIVIPNGVNTNRFQPRDSKREKALLYVGRMAAIKGVHILIESMKQVLREAPDWRLWLVGGAMDQPKSFFESHMDTFAKSRIDFMGAVPNEQLPDIMDKAGIFVMPTLRDGFEIALMEAMASGIPCISTAAFERKELYGGFVNLVPPNDSEALGRAIVEIIQNYDRYVTSEARSRRVLRAREFDWSRIVMKYQTLFRRVVS